MKLSKINNQILQKFELDIAQPENKKEEREILLKMNNNNMKLEDFQNLKSGI